MKCSCGKARRDEQRNLRLAQNMPPAKDFTVKPSMHERHTQPQAVRPLDNTGAQLQESAARGRAMRHEPSAASSSSPRQHVELDLLDAQTECRRLVRAGTKMHEEILLLHNELATTRQQIQALLADQQELAQARVKSQSLEALVDALLQSASWRITKPLRLLYSLLTSRA